MPPTHEVLQPASSSPRSPSTAGGTGPGGLDGFFRISERGSTVAREFRGGLATFFTMAYIVVLNPIILGSGVDKFGQRLSVGQLTTATALVAAVMTLIMGVGGNLPLAIASGLGLNACLLYTSPSPRD